MYNVDKKDKVIPLENIPQSSVGAPCSVVLSDDNTTVVSYFTQEADSDYESEIVELATGEFMQVFNEARQRGKEEIEPKAIITFRCCRSTIFGPPNDEAFDGHPLSSRGLKPYSSFLIENSSWLRTLIKMNEVHPCHNLKMFKEYKHFILTFHDSTFECIAKDFEVEIVADTFTNVISLMQKKLK